MKALILITFVAVAALSVRAQCVPASTAAGALDTCFGTGGKVTTDVTNDRDYARALALQSDGKILVAGISGYTAGQNNADFLVIRYNTDGSLDTTFGGGDGIVTTDIGPAVQDDDYARGMAILPDGKIVVAGRSFVTATTYALVVVRYNTDGSLDATFDGDGKAFFEMAAIIEMYGFALQPDGRMVVAGRSYLNGTYTGLIVRFNPNGSIDTSFGTNGSTTANISGIFSLALQPDGKIIAGGVTGVDPAFSVVRLNQNGSLDMSFGTMGVVTHHPTFSDQTWFVKLRPDNRIVIGGHSSVVQGDARGTLLRFNTNGVLSQSVVYPDDNAFWNATFQPDAKMLTVGAAWVPFSGFTIRRWLDIAAPDTTFNGGWATVKFLPAATAEASGVNAITLTRDNQIIAAGSVTEQNNTTAGWRIAVARLYSGLQAPHPERFDFDGDRKADLSIYRPSNGEWWHQRSSDGGNGAVRFGSQTDVMAPGDYTGDGKTDVAIWRASSGMWYVLRSEDFSYYAFTFGANGDVPRASDFDADGRTDYVIYRPSQNTWYRMDASGIRTSTVQFGASGDRPVIGDFDGDGKTDPAIFRPSNGEWWYRSSSNDAQIAAMWGVSTDVATPADFDGDGKTDLAVYRPSEGTWYIRNSSNLTTLIVRWGIAADRPVPADYDGDGKADVAVFRPSNGTWYLLRSTAGATASHFGLPGDLATPAAFIQ